MSNFATIQTKLKAILDAIITASEIDAVYKYNPIELDGTPAIVIVPTDSGEEITTTCENELSANFVIRCLVENTNDQSAQTTRLLTVVDDVMAELRKNDNETLGGLCHYFLVEDISPIEFGEIGTIKVMFMDLTLSAKSLNSISTP